MANDNDELVDRVIGMIKVEDWNGLMQTAGINEELKQDDWSKDEIALKCFPFILRKIFKPFAKKISLIDLRLDQDANVDSILIICDWIIPHLQRAIFTSSILSDLVPVTMRFLEHNSIRLKSATVDLFGIIIRKSDARLLKHMGLVDMIWKELRGLLALTTGGQYIPLQRHVSAIALEMGQNDHAKMHVLIEDLIRGIEIGFAKEDEGRAIFLVALRNAMITLGINGVIWMERLLPVARNAHSMEGLELVLTIMDTCEPRIHHHRHKLLAILAEYWVILDKPAQIQVGVSKLTDVETDLAAMYNEDKTMFAEVVGAAPEGRSVIIS